MMSEDRYKDLVTLVSKINDFVLQSEQQAATDTIDETHGVAVILDRDDESEEVGFIFVFYVTHPFSPLSYQI